MINVREAPNCQRPDCPLNELATFAVSAASLNDVVDRARRHPEIDTQGLGLGMGAEMRHDTESKRTFTVACLLCKGGGFFGIGKTLKTMTLEESVPKLPQDDLEQLHERIKNSPPLSEF